MNKLSLHHKYINQVEHVIGVKSIITNSPIVAIEDQIVEGFKLEKVLNLIFT